MKNAEYHEYFQTLTLDEQRQELEILLAEFRAKLVQDMIESTKQDEAQVLV